MQERPTYALRHDRWTLVHSFRNGHTALFDRRRDPGERDDLSARLPVRAELMRQELVRWLRDLRRAAGVVPPEPALTPEGIELLRSLGYVGPG
jgi:arylsulfatase A-like enzyme